MPRRTQWGTATVLTEDPMPNVVSLFDILPAKTCKVFLYVDNPAALDLPREKKSLVVDSPWGCLDDKQLSSLELEIHLLRA